MASGGCGRPVRLLQRPLQPKGAGEGERRRVQEGVPGRVQVRGGAVRVRGRRRRRLLLPAVGGAVDGDVAAGGGALQLHHASQGAGHASSVSRDFSVKVEWATVVLDYIRFQSKTCDRDMTE